MWPERVEAWERHLFRAEMEEYEKHRRECARENAAIIKDAKELLVHDIKAYLEKAKATEDPTKPVLSPGQFTNLLEAVITLEKNKQRAPIQPTKIGHRQAAGSNSQDCICHAE